MSLEAVIQRILERGAAEADEVTKAAMREKEIVLQRIREKGQEHISNRTEDARKAADRLRIQEVARAELEAKKIALGAQKEILDSVRTEVLSRLRSTDNNRDLLRTLLEKHRTEWRSGKVHCNGVDREFVISIVGTRIGGTIECAGGIVIESDDGTRRMDLRFETLLQDLWEDSVKELADLLWPQP